MSETKLIQDLAVEGMAVVGGLDISTSSEIVRLARLVGNTDLEIDPHLSGPLVMDLQPDEDKIAVGQRPAYFTTDAFELHIDMSYVAMPPRYLLTQCVRPDPAGGGATLVADCQEAWGRTSSDSRAVLSEPVFEFTYPPGCQVGATEKLAVSWCCGQRRVWRFRYDSMSYPTWASQAVGEFREALAGTATTHSLESGDVLILDNNRMAHGRTAFTTHVDRPNRHLRRVYARDVANG